MSYIASIAAPTGAVLLVLLTVITGCQRVDSNPNARLQPDIQTLWDYDEPAGSERRFRDALAAADGLPALEAEWLTQIARAQGLQREFETAIDTLDEADALITSDMTRARIRSMLERGRVQNSSGRRAAARPLFLGAWELARDTGADGLAVDAAHMMAIIEPPNEAMRWNERALELARTSDDPDAQRWQGSLHNNIGWSWHESGDYDRALEHFEAARDHRLESGTPSDQRVARWAVARCLRSQGRVEEALALQRALELDHLEAESADGYVFEEIGECLLALDRPDEARPYFRRAWELLSEDPWLVESDTARMNRLRSRGGLDAPSDS